VDMLWVCCGPFQGAQGGWVSCADRHSTAPSANCWDLVSCQQSSDPRSRPALRRSPRTSRTTICAALTKLFAFSTMQHEVQKLRKKLGLPPSFTFDACRHGGMTELEEAELTDGQGRALSAHKTQESYVRYAKRTEKRMLSATRKRHAHLLANKLVEERENETSTSVRNDSGFAVRNDTREQKKINE
jgi:hypothetical protein